jgi:hypothetical protein
MSVQWCRTYQHRVKQLCSCVSYLSTRLAGKPLTSSKELVCDALDEQPAAAGRQADQAEQQVVTARR